MRPSTALPSPPPLNGDGRRLRIAVVGSGISGLSCAWLLSQRHEVDVFEADGRVGGHSHTVDAPCGAWMHAPATAPWTTHAWPI